MYAFPLYFYFTPSSVFLEKFIHVVSRLNNCFWYADVDVNAKFIFLFKLIKGVLVQSFISLL